MNFSPSSKNTTIPLKWQSRNKNCGCICTYGSAKTCTMHTPTSKCSNQSAKWCQHTKTNAIHTRTARWVCIVSGNGRRKKKLIRKRNAWFGGSMHYLLVVMMAVEENYECVRKCAPRRMNLRADRSVAREVIGFYFRCAMFVFGNNNCFFACKHPIDANYIYLLLFRRTHKVNNTANENDSHTWSHMQLVYLFCFVSISCERANDTWKKNSGN